MQDPLANFNGEVMPLADVRVSVLDRAFLFGDAVYEMLRVYSGRPWLCAEHFERLHRSLREVAIDCDLSRLESRMHQTLQASGVDQAYVYIQVTRGVARRTHYFPDPPVSPTELIYVDPLDGDPYAEHRPHGAPVITHQDLRWGRRDIKSVNLLGNCLANQAAQAAGCFEAILVEPDGRITEGTHTSLFGVKDGCVMTSPRGPHILPGITRGFVLHLAEKAGVPILEASLRHDNLFEVDELFLTGTGTEVLPVTRVDGRPIGDGRPGSVALRLYSTYRQCVAEWLAQRQV